MGLSRMRQTRLSTAEVMSHPLLSVQAAKLAQANQFTSGCIYGHTLIKPYRGIVHCPLIASRQTGRPQQRSDTRHSCVILRIISRSAA